MAARKKKTTKKAAKKTTTKRKTTRKKTTRRKVAKADDAPVRKKRRKKRGKRIVKDVATRIHDELLKRAGKCVDAYARFYKKGNRAEAEAHRARADVYEEAARVVSEMNQ